MGTRHPDAPQQGAYLRYVVRCSRGLSKRLNRINDELFILVSHKLLPSLYRFILSYILGRLLFRYLLKASVFSAISIFFK